MAPKAEQESRRYSRRSFLGKVSLGVLAVAGVGLLARNFLFSGGSGASSSSDEFPGEDSIFHPRRDPRLEAQERRKNS